MTDRAKIEAAIRKGAPLPLTFHWQEGKDGNELLQIALPGQTQAGRPTVMVAFPAGMPAPYVPKAIARAKALIDEIFDANMVGIAFVGGPQPQLAVPEKKLLLMPGGAMAGRA